LKPEISSHSWHILLAALVLVVFAVQVALGSPANSAAFDEEYHLAAGYAYLRTGDPRLATEHPPLVNLWNALPLVFLDPKLPLDNPAWQNSIPDDFGDVFLWQANTNLAVRMVLLGRLPIMVLGVLLGAVVFRWTRDLFGTSAALVALGVYALDPNLIAHSRLSTTDLGLAAMMTIAMWRLWAWLEKPTRWNLLLVGLTAGAAMATKFTGLILAPTFLLVALIHPARHPESRRFQVSEKIRRLFDLILAGLIALLVIWAVYGFQVRGGLPAATYWRGLVKIYTEYSQGYPTFLLGQVSRTGWWYYFPITFALKTPLPTLILLVVGAALCITQHTWRSASAALIPPAFSMAAAMFSPLAIGYRHILPVLPFVIIIVGNAVHLKSRRSPRRFARETSSLEFQIQLPHHLLKFETWHVIFGALCLWLVASAIFIFPHHLSYFNELAGGPSNGDKVLVDSNLDWGQDLPALKAWMDKHSIDRVNLSYFGTALPGLYGVRYWPLPGFLHFISNPDMNSFNPYTPEPGWYAISATSLRLGLLYREQDLFAYFRDKTPAARAGYSLLLYKVDYAPNAPTDRAVVVGTATYSIPPQTLGVVPGHRLIAKWANDPNVFIFAMNGSARYITPDPLPFDRNLRKAFRSAAQKDGDTLVVDARPLVESRLAEWRANWMLRLPDSRPLDSPADFGSLALIGYLLESATAAPGGALNLTMYWQVTSELEPSTAFFAHVTDEAQRIIGQYDGWGTARRGLEIGDVIVQHVSVPIKADTPSGSYSLQLGVYSTDTMVRSTLHTPSGASADRALLSPITVR
jgi:4-amino-4-deoxy-L-arabinose transferase-like glycosyltransferase